VAIFVLTSILKELQWQIRIETDQTVDQNELLAVVLVRALAGLGAMIVILSRLARLGRSALPITLIRLIQSPRRHLSQTKSTQQSCR
jgi:hypothetical protein